MLNIELPYDLAVPLLGIDIKTRSHKTCTQMFIVVLFIIAKKWKHKYPSTDECINKMQYIYTWNIIQSLKGTKYWYMLQQRWT